MRVQQNDQSVKMSFKTEAEEVIFYSSANGFKPLQASKNGEWWTVTINNTKKMKYFLKTDENIYIPECKMKEFDDFGGELCIYER